MKRDEYESKMQRMIDDDETYLKLNRDPTAGYQKRNNNFAKCLADLKLIDRATERRMKTYKATAPRIYGAPKAHKEGLPLRPVVPCMTSPSYTLSQFVGKIIQKSITGKYNATDSYTFCEYINSVQLPPDYVLISLDVVSLFTCIPKNLVIRDVIHNWENIKQHTDINLDLFLEMTEFCIDCSYFRFKGQFYRQVFDTAMGNPLSPTIADLVMEALLDNVVARIDFPFPVLKKYVDDLMLAVPKDKIEEVRKIFNEYNEKIQFTVEVEENGKIPFLDLLLVRQPDQTIKTEWYMKPIASGRFLNYHSAHSIKQKVNVANNFIRRVQTFSTNVDTATTRDIITTQLKLNDYPTTMINRLIDRSRERQVNPTNEDVTDSEETIYRSMVQVGQLSGNIQKILKKDYPNVTISSKNAKTVGNMLPPVKDVEDKNSRSNVIYNIPCADCPACYVGMTTNKLQTRISSHRSCSNRLQSLWDQGKTTEDVEVAQLRERTALLDHSAANHHVFAFDRTRIVDSSFKQQNLHILETCHIVNTHNTVNKRTDTDNLSNTYAGVLHTLRNNTRSEAVRQTDESLQQESIQSE
ncbi:uncharacterized protein LOC134286667 [Aedes albopictus]|uniref:Reverse transcriptase domain-containing protein n=1 Tax=Aedes albopictus TaxID=7160 RepID=A0ABM1XQU3_AEDAL